MTALFRHFLLLPAFLALLVASGCGGSAASSSIPAAVSKAPSNAAGTSSPAQLTPVTIQISTAGFAFFPVLLARDLGIFAKHGIEANVVTMPPPAAIAGMQKGDVQFSAALGSSGRAIERGLPLRILEIGLARPPLTLIGGPGITQLSQIQGHVISAGGADESLTQITVALLEKHGLPPNSYQIVATGPNQAARLAILASKQAVATPVDFVFPIANGDELKAEGNTVLASMAEEFDLPFSGLATSQDLIKAQPDVVRRMVAAMVEANQVAASDKARTTQVLAKELSVTVEGAAKVFDVAKTLNMWSPDGRPTSSGLSLLFKLDQAALELPAPPTEAQLFDWSFLPSSQTKS